MALSTGCNLGKKVDLQQAFCFGGAGAAVLSFMFDVFIMESIVGDSQTGHER